MNRMIKRAGAALVLGVALTGSAAWAAEANQQSCRHLDYQVGRAAENHADSPNLPQARDERTEAQQDCRAGFYKLGVSHYLAAL